MQCITLIGKNQGNTVIVGLTLYFYSDSILFICSSLRDFADFAPLREDNTHACFAGNMTLAEARRAQRIRRGYAEDFHLRLSTPWKGVAPTTKKGA